MLSLLEIKRAINDSMKMPGFTRRRLALQDARPYGCITMSAHRTGRREVICQLKGSVFRTARGGSVFGPIIDTWNCIQGCGSAYDSCLKSCEGAGSLHCVTCDEEYRACLDGCSRGGGGGGGISIA
jgi:hypothetical protein